MAIAEARIWQDLRALRAASVAHGVAAGDAVLAPEVVAHVHGARGPVPAGVLDALDARDRDVLAHMVASRTNRGIARLLFLSERDRAADHGDLREARRARVAARPPARARRARLPARCGRRRRRVPARVTRARRPPRPDGIERYRNLSVY